MAAAVLADIGGRALIAEVGRGTVVIGEGARRQPGAVVVEIADRVGQAVPLVKAVGAVVAMVASRLRHGYRYDRGQQGGGCDKLQRLHPVSPKIPLKPRRQRRSVRNLAQN